MQGHSNLANGHVHVHVHVHVHQMLLCGLAAIRAVAVQQPEYLGIARCSMCCGHAAVCQ